MRKRHFVYLIAATWLCPLVRAMNLTPMQTTVESEGGAFNRSYFQDGEKKMSFRMDNKTTVNGDAGSATFAFSDLAMADMKLRRSPYAPMPVFDQRTLEAVRVAARGMLPREAMEVTMEQEIPNSIAINGWTSYQLVFKFKLYTSIFRESITFLNYSGKEQLLVVVSAKADDYQKAYFRGYRVLNSFFEIRDADKAHAPATS